MINVRNEVMEEWSRVLQGKMKDRNSQSIFHEFSTLSPDCRTFIERHLHEIIDSNIFQTMSFFEQKCKMMYKSWCNQTLVSS